MNAPNKLEWFQTNLMFADKVEEPTYEWNIWKMLPSLALIIKIRIAWKSLPGQNTLVYYEYS